MPHPPSSTCDEAARFHRRFAQGPVWRNEVAASIEIDAPRALVWDVLSDLAAYPQWNTFTPLAEAVFAVGEKVRLRVLMPGTRARFQTEWINRIEPGRSFCWGVRFGHPLILVANRWRELESTEDGGTRYVTVDRFSGLLVPLVFWLYEKGMRLGFELAAANLKQRARLEDNVFTSDARQQQHPESRHDSPQFPGC